MQLDLESEGCDRRGLSSTCVPGGPTSFRVPFWRSRHIYCGCRVCRWSPEWSLQTLPVANIDKPRRDKHTTRSHSEPAYSTPHRELTRAAVSETQILAAFYPQFQRLIDVIYPPDVAKAVARLKVIMPVTHTHETCTRKLHRIQLRSIWCKFPI